MVRRIIVKRPPPRPRPPGPPSLRAEGFARFFDRIMIHGLEYFGLYYGVYRAVVVANEDPDAEGQPDPQCRLFVRIPAVGDTREARRMAYPIVPFAGDGYGLKALPPVDGHVYVVFENGHVETPLWLGGWWASGDIPDDLKAPEVHFWITPTGHQIIMNGTDGSEEILIKHSNGAQVQIDSQGSIFLTNKSGQKVNVGDGSDTANEPAVLGETLKGLLEQLCDACAAITVTTIDSPEGAPVNNATQFTIIKAQIQRILSGTVNVK